MENNNDKAKKILFGNDLIWDQIKDKMKQAWDEEAHKEKATPEQIIAKFNATPKQFGPVPPINWHEEHERFDQINRVLDYCNEAGISPDKLIEQHALWLKTFGSQINMLETCEKFEQWMKEYRGSL